VAATTVTLASSSLAAPLCESLSNWERLNFLVTNRIPRRWATLFMGRFSKIRNPLVRELSFFIWQRFADDLKLEDADKDRFESLHECSTRKLKPGLRPVDPDPAVVVSPCDAVVGACGSVAGQQVFQTNVTRRSARERRWASFNTARLSFSSRPAGTNCVAT
jgi:phosphatidylserine decarboxylase